MRASKKGFVLNKNATSSAVLDKSREKPSGVRRVGVEQFQYLKAKDYFQGRTMQTSRQHLNGESLEQSQQL